MAKARVSTNPMYTGGAGGYSFYVRGGEQVVRQRRNNSNYGESASRTEAQMLRRIKWGNLVNVYKALSSWQPKAYEFKAAGQTDYNIFMSMNINSAQCSLTKDMANNGCAVQEGFSVSRGSLAPIERAVTDPSGGIGTNITMSITPSSSTTVAQLSSNILANNPLYQEGDNIAFILFINFLDNRGYPYLTTQYTELTLDTSDTTAVQTIPLLDRIIPGDNGDLAFRCGAARSGESGLVMIHTRREGGILKVSSQTIWGTGETLIDQFTGPGWEQECILSYGLDQSVPLDPGAGGGGVTPSGGNYFSAMLTGEDNTLVTSDRAPLSAGRYRISCYPAQYAVTNVTATFNVFAIEGFSANNVETDLFLFKKEDFADDGTPNGAEFDLPANLPELRFAIRADEGVKVVVSVIKIS